MPSPRSLFSICKTDIGPFMNRATNSLSNDKHEMCRLLEGSCGILKQKRFNYQYILWGGRSVLEDDTYRIHLTNFVYI